ncbi:VanZ family protein [Paenarthrobacter nicotinovorans]|uniref:VanZ family protein n=1 Tax=Paenarthrobacter nicotinovorans TaxID=29320 RepID=UPI0035934160
MEASANFLMFVPLGLLAAMALAKTTWWKISLLAAITSIGVEVGQLLLLSGRVPSILDVITNTLGAVTGVVAARLLAPAPRSPLHERVHLTER